MAGLRLFTSNRLEILADNLARVLAEPLRSSLSSPFSPELIVVQSKGMERWVSQQLALRHGICANVQFPFPNALLQDLFESILGVDMTPSPFDPKVITWTLMGLLRQCADKAELEPGFEFICDYLAPVDDSLKRYQLASRIADTFDQYGLFRPEMVLGWDCGKEDHWQARLWRRLVHAHGGTNHRADCGKRLLEALCEDPTITNSLPGRISVFGISHLPRFHVKVLEGLASKITINLFVMNPCESYWGDIRSEKEISRSLRNAPHISKTDLHWSTGNSLLASMGKLGRDFLDMLSELQCFASSAFDPQAQDSLLSAIQSDILYLRETVADGEKRKVAAQDSSIEIHSCHSPMREMEVLHDRLLDLFQKDPCLLAKDVLIMTPDIKSYAPYIQAVFDLPIDDPRKLPFTISDQNYRDESRLVDTFLATLDLSHERFSAPQVLEILEADVVQRRFDLNEPDLEVVRRWVTDTRIRWGIDGQDRSRLGLPSIETNTWRAGLDRLMLGYAISGNEQHSFAGIVPYDDIEGSDDTGILAAFVEFCEELFSCIEMLRKPKTLREWAISLTDLITRLFLPGEANHRGEQLLRGIFKDLTQAAQDSGFNEAIDLAPVRAYLGSRLEKDGSGSGFLTGRITFCAMLPMRSIPFKVLCLVGMDDRAYPRQAKPIGFDLMASRPAPGDRCQRDEDRYVFLEALLSARKTLYISYVGQSIQDNSLIPPSVLVSELTDYIDQCFTCDDTSILDKIQIIHRLQPFNSEYFKVNGKLFSYSNVNFRACQEQARPRRPAKPFLQAGLPVPPIDPGVGLTIVNLNDLCRFFQNPAQFFLVRRLGLQFEKEDSALEETELFCVKGLERYMLSQRILNQGINQGISSEQTEMLQTTATALGQLPHGTPGQCAFELLNDEVLCFLEQTQGLITSTKLSPIDVDLKVTDFRLVGRIDDIFYEKRLQFRCAKIAAKDRLTAWIHHLVINSIELTGYPKNSVLAGLQKTKDKGKRRWIGMQYHPVENSLELLEQLLTLYAKGMEKPLHFFPESSWIYAQRVKQQGKSDDEALSYCKTVWNRKEGAPAECEDAYMDLCFRNVDPLDDEFKQIALCIFGPLILSELPIKSL